jgi:hypothetical protein
MSYTKTKEMLVEDLIYLCEVRGELDEESNAVIEAKISDIEKQIEALGGY